MTFLFQDTIKFIKMGKRDLWRFKDIHKEISSPHLLISTYSNKLSGFLVHDRMKRRVSMTLATMTLEVVGSSWPRSKKWWSFLLDTQDCLRLSELRYHAHTHMQFKNKLSSQPPIIVIVSILTWHLFALLGMFFPSLSAPQRYPAVRPCRNRKDPGGPSCSKWNWCLLFPHQWWDFCLLRPENLKHRRK